MLSIIIPALNEEDYLPRLLKSIKAQDFKDYEIIVADANSKDKTVEIAKSYGCRVIKGGLPAKARNNGAKVAKGSILLFLDADGMLPPHFLQKCLKEFHFRKLDCATCCVTSDTNSLSDFLIISLANLLLVSVQYFNPHAIGQCIFVRKEWHKKIHGFDESLFQAEDHNYVKRISKNKGQFRVLKSAKIVFCTRRFYKDGRIKPLLKYIYVALHRTFIGELKKPVFKYFDE